MPELLPPYSFLRLTRAPAVPAPQPDAAPPAPARVLLSEAELLEAFEAHYPALLRFCRVEGIGYVLCAHVAAAEGAAVRFALGAGWVLLRLRPDGRFGMPWAPLTARGVAYLVVRALPVRNRRMLRDGPWPEGRRWGLKWATTVKEGGFYP